MTTKRVDSKFYSRVKLRELALMSSPVKDYEQVVCCLETRIIEKLNRISMQHKMLKDKFIDKIVPEFQPTTSDNYYLTEGIYRTNFAQTLSTFFSIPEERQFVTFHVYKDTLGKLNSYKNFYGLNKSAVLKYIILKYIKDNNL